MAFEYFILLVTALFPYLIVGQDAGAALLCLIGTIFLFSRRKNLNVPDKKIIFAFLALFFSMIPSFFTTGNFEKSLEGLFFYIDLLIYLFVLLNFRMSREKVFRILYNTLLIAAAASIAYQGLYQGVRISGNFTYANTYGLVLLFGLIIGDITAYKNELIWKKLVLILGIIFTGSRSTAAFLIIYVLLCVIKGKKDGKRFTSLIALLLSSGIYALKYIHPVIPLVSIFLVIAGEYILLKKKVQIKVPNPKITAALLGVTVLISFALFMYFPSNFKARLENISPKNGVVQERLVIYSDVLHKIVRNPLGAGLNSFEYNQYSGQTAFYDVRYVHNAILQIAHDTGIASCLIFIGILGLLLHQVIKNKDMFRINKLYMFSAIILHSFWDFDMSFATVGIFMVLLSAFSTQQIQTSKNGKTKLTAAFILFSCLGIYSLGCMLLMYMGDSEISNGRFSSGRNLYSFDLFITVRNPDACFLIAQSYYTEAQLAEDRNSYRQLLFSCRENLLKAEKMCGYDPRITTNLAFVNKMLDEPEKAIKYFKASIKLQKFNMQIYDAFYNYLLEMFQSTHDDKYLKEIGKLKLNFKNNYKKLNPAAKYLRDQLIVKSWLK
ncbi:MAG TPA: O-antigen ligase family protein [Clostridia bacterium]|nr:O-antigen ligase family protein [Clostridia bacterium]